MDNNRRYDLSGWANVKEGGFVMDFINPTNPPNWKEIVSDKKLITIFLKIYDDDDREIYYTFERDKHKFSLLRVCHLINKAYMKACRDYYGGDFDMVSYIAINGFNVIQDDRDEEDIKVRVYFST